MQGCMYSLKIVVPGMSLVILLPACQLNRGLKLKLQLRAYYRKSLLFTDQRKIFMLIEFSVNNVNKFFQQHFDQLFQIHI